MDIPKKSLELHYEKKGKIEVISRVAVKNREDLSLAYTPGVATPCLEIQKDPSKVYDLTRRGNLVAVITDGSAVLGLGDIGPEASMPVMEGKCVLLKAFGGIDAVPICVDSKDTQEFIKAVTLISKSFGGINLEDISAPRCFEIETRLKEICDIPVFHDDQHGTAIIVLAAMLNGLKIIGKSLKDVSVVVNGAGAAGISVTKHLMKAGLADVILVDRTGAIYEGRENLDESKQEIARVTNRHKKSGRLCDVIKGADVFVGVSAPGVLTEDMVKSMAKDPMVFPLANPTPEIMPDLALAAGAKIVGTGRSDFPNQINNVLAFPGIFRGALDVRATDINEEMKMAASYALADLVGIRDLRPDYIIPEAFDERVAPCVAKAVSEAAIKSGVARIKL